VAGTGAVLLVGAAQAQTPPEKVGNGIPTGQMSVQMFNYGGWISNAGGQGAAPPAQFQNLTPSCLTDTDPGAPDTRTTAACRTERLRALFAFLRAKGVTSIELFGHANFPANDDIAGLTAYRALLDEYGLHAGGWHGSMNEAQWPARVNAAKILGADYIGSGGVADPGITSYDAVLRSAQALNRMGKYAVENGVGPTYIHNHTEEFDRMYVDDGVLKYTYDILMERTDPRYVVGELDVFWSSDAFDDVTGTATAAFMDKWGSRIQMLHIKDGINAGLRSTNPNSSAPSRAGSPRATGTGEIDFRPIFAEALGNARYYHQEHDGGSLTDADISLTNLKGRGPSVVGTLHAKPPVFNSVPANTPGTSNVTPVVVQNTGDSPLTINTGNNAVQIQALGTPNDTADFQIVSQNCSGATLPAGNPNVSPALPRGTCVVNVGFRPSKTNYTSVARLQFASTSDSATESVLLAARSTGDALSTVGGDVPSVLQLSVSPSTSFGTFVPNLTQAYTTALSATALATTGNAELAVSDASTTAPGHLVNGAFSLPSALGARALALGDPTSTPYTSLSETAATPVTLKSWSSPIAATALTVGLRQQIAASDVLRAGTYSKTLTFTLSTTTP
jgi:sugar phosphate isomerase/epimerase